MDRGVFGAEQTINLFRPLEGFLRLLQGKLQIIGAALAADNDQRIRCVQGEQRADIGDAANAGRALVPIPVCIGANPIVEGADRADGYGELHAWIDGSNPVRRVGAARLAGEAYPLGVHFRTRQQHVERANRVELFE